VSVDTHTESSTHRSVVEVRAVTADGATVSVAGALTGLQQVEKLVQINGRSFDIRAEGNNVLISYADAPGVLGKIGTVLGEAGIDIQAAALSRDAEGSGATIIARLSETASDDVLSALKDAVSASRVEQFDLA